jgi:carbon monoxide dehydrogenase subunit G
VKIERSVDVTREQGDVWAVLRDPALMPVWFSSLENFSAVEGDGTRAGDRYTIDYVRESGTKHLAVEVLEVDEPNGHIHLFEGLPVAFSISSRLTGDGSATIWAATIEVRLSLVQRALGPVIKVMLDGLADDMSNSFKQYVEAK